MEKKTFTKKLMILTVQGFMALNIMTNTVSAASDFSLPTLQKDILGRYAGVQHMSGQTLEGLIAKDPKKLVLFDVREVAEFNVGHIPGAIQVAPNIWHSSFMKKYGSLLKGKTIIFYCSVGVRSSKLALYVQKAAKQTGAEAIFNLKYGIFGWHNDKRALEDKNGTTLAVHPYNKHWGQLVKQQKLIRYKPLANKAAQTKK